MNIMILIRCLVLAILTLLQVCLLLLFNLFLFVYKPKTIMDFYRIVTRKPFSRDGKPPPVKWNDPSLGEHSILKLKETKMHYVASGDEDKPLMLFIHGLLDCWYTWRYQIREFNKYYRVVAIDMRGYSLSDCPAEKSNYTLSKNAADVAEAIEALGYKDAILVGYNFGAIIALLTSHSFPEKVSKVIDLDIAPAPDHSKNFCIELSDFKFYWPMIYSRIPYSCKFMLTFDDFKTFESLYWHDNIVRKENLTKEDLEVYKYALSQKNSMDVAFHNYHDIFKSAAQCFKREKSELNILVIHGTRNIWTKQIWIDDSKEYYPNGVFKNLEGGTLCMHQDQPSLVNEMIHQYLKQGLDKE